MKKQFFLISIVVALAAFGGWKILHSQPGGEAHHAEGDGHEHAEHAGHAHEEHGEEGHVELSPEARKNAGLKIEKAGPARIKTVLSVYGKVAVNEEAVAHVMPRFPGIVKAVRKRLGDPVEKGEALAVVESNESLRPYEMKSELAGVVVKKEVTPGEFVKDDKALFTVADLSTVWVDLSVFRQDFSRLKTGQPVEIQADDGKEVILDKIDYISPFGAENSQTALVRAVLPNPGGRLRPGLFISARITTGEAEAPVAVRATAVQTLKEKPVVFVEEGDAFEAREVRLGASDGEWVEIVSGLRAGEPCVTENSFILKAHLGKEEAEHEH